jgi:hypothetical protein
VKVIQSPRDYKIPNWFLNRQKDFKDGTYTQLVANNVDIKLREDIERLKKIRYHQLIPTLSLSHSLTLSLLSLTLTLIFPPIRMQMK